MKSNLKLLCAAATLLATAAVTSTHAAVLTLSPAAISAQPGQTAGWGFSLLNDDTANYLLVTGTEFTLAPLSAFGSYTDLLGPRGFLSVAPLASLTEGYDALLGTGIGEFSFAPSANGRLDGEIRLYYALSSVDPNSPDFDPDLHFVSFDASVAAQASAMTAAVPEPSTWSLFAIAGLLALARRRLSSRSTA